MSRYGLRSRPPRARGRGPRSSGRRLPVANWVAIGVTCILVGGFLYGYYKVRDLWDGINHITVTGLGKRPPRYNNSLNILLIGSDSRSGRNGKIGGYTPGQRSDTVMILHISPGRSRLSVLSFPRDSVVPILKCPPEAGFPGQAAQVGGEQLNATFANGGPGCLWHTLEHETGILINDFIQLNFTGFISVINALNGVEICLPYAIHPTYYDHLNLPRGPHLLKGYKALEYWRLREGFGLGSDLQRIQRDQLLMVSLVQKVLKSGVLHSVSKTYAILKAIVDARALTTDTGLTPSRILTIATSMSGISRKSIQFIEVPTVTYPANPNWVEFDATQDPKLFSAVAHDNKLPKIIKKKKKGKKGKKGGAPKLLSTSKVSVEVLNGSGANGIAGRTATALAGRGFHVLGSAGATNSTGAPDYNYGKSVVEYGSATELAAARTVAAQLKIVTLREVSSVPAGQVNLILGKDFTVLAAKPAKPLGNLTGQYGGYTGGTNICKGYGTAFLTAGG